MGWCSATNIMDSAVKAAEQAVAFVVTNPEKIWHDTKNLGFLREDLQAAVDEVLRPFVAKIAEMLRDDDWDCVEEADAFERFPQEMLGHDDDEWESWLIRMIDDHQPEQRPKYVKWLKELYERQGRN